MLCLLHTDLIEAMDAKDLKLYLLFIADAMLKEYLRSASMLLKKKNAGIIVHTTLLYWVQTATIFENVFMVYICML